MTGVWGESSGRLPTNELSSQHFLSWLASGRRWMGAVVVIDFKLNIYICLFSSKLGDLGRRGALAFKTTSNAYN